MSYVILGRAIKNEYLALGTIFSAVGITMLATGGKKEAPAQKPTLAQVKDSVKIDASSKYVPSQHSVVTMMLTCVPCVPARALCREEEEFIKNFIAEAEKDSKH
ncbi:hypothetical protein ONZ51_g3324 [Trametes cubensis]|uniref:Uncharacterized protein n=1 Tax=Trametes cubensis TaxID=1111947 RepID=A0AAD7TY02_9APHY|nr:hypothetical protein ONZ51_g3324 [Trametes cubensis]